MGRTGLGTLSRISGAFAAAPGRTGLIAYLTAGYPSLDITLELMLRLSRTGARAIELGVPFSDPIADGAEIQRASEWALRTGVDLDGIFDVLARFRSESETPVVIMTYANPVVRRDPIRFGREAAAAGADGVLISDLPVDEADDLWDAMADAGLDTVTLVSPTTPPGRLDTILDRCRGFVYCLARMGVTGRSAGEGFDLDSRIAAVRERTTLPIAVGFGISSPADARALRGRADAIVVGAAFMRAIAESPEHGAAGRVEALARGLIEALELPA